jgi:hypothetical protein
VSRPEPEPSRLLLGVLTGVVVLGALLRRRPVRGLPQGVHPEDLAEGYEHSDISPAVVLVGAAGLLVILVVVLVAVTSFEAAVTGSQPSLSRPADLVQGLQAVPAPTPPQPRLEAESGQEYAAYLAAEQQKLTTYRWVDRQAGSVAIPVERAIDLLAQRGLPTRSAPTVAARDDGAHSPSSSSSGRVEEAYP